MLKVNPRLSMLLALLVGVALAVGLQLPETETTEDPELRNPATQTETNEELAKKQVNPVTDALGGFFNTQREAPQELKDSKSSPSGGQKDGHDDKKGFYGFKNGGDLAKFIFHPFELVKSISEHFKLPLDKFVEKLGSSWIFGLEALLQPAVVSVKIIEKVFVPDACRLRLFCSMGSKLAVFKDTVLKFSSVFLNESSQIRALTDGIIGRDCELAFEKCDPKLKKPYELLKANGESSSEARAAKGEGKLASQEVMASESKVAGRSKA